MKKSIKNIIAGILLVPMLAVGVISTMPITASALTCDTGWQAAVAEPDMCVPDNCKDLATVKLGACIANNGNTTTLFGTGSIFQTITNTALFIIGALSVIMLIYGGIKYVLSSGDAKQVESAKNTIMYAIIGVIVALLAGAIVNFVLTTLIK